MPQPTPILEFAGSREQPAKLDAQSVFNHVVHELRQPLSAMESVAYYLSMILPPHGRAREQVAKLQQLIEEANDVLTDGSQMLETVPPQLTLMDVNEIISTLLVESSMAATLDLTLDLEDALPLVRMDPWLANHLFANVFRLLRHVSGRQQNKATLRSFTSDGTVFVEMTAPAPAFAADQVRRLLAEPGRHLRSGSGLAAASVRRAVDNHGGNIDVRASGGRAIFLVSFPAAN
jgi:signal transduction histidine kinase